MSERVVRVRSRSSQNISGGLDIKVSLTKKNNNKYEVKWSASGLTSDYNLKNYQQSKKDSFFTTVKGYEYSQRQYSDDIDMIDGFNPSSDIDSAFILNETILSYQKADSTIYDVVQDPWTDEAPIIRSFGFDPYYLNDGSKIFISWIDGDYFLAGGKQWSDYKGNELNMLPGETTQSTKGFITKTLISFSPDDVNTQIVNNKSGFFEKNGVSSNNIEYGGFFPDLEILKQFIASYNMKIPNYKLELCDPPHTSYIEIEYKSVLEPLDSSDPVVVDSDDNKVPESSTTKRQELLIVIPSDIDAKVKEDLPSLKIYVGKLPDNSRQGFDFGDDEEADLSLLGDEYQENIFNGKAELSELEQQGYDDPKSEAEANHSATIVNSVPYTQGKHTLDMIPGEFVTNNKTGIRCCQIHGKAVNANIADVLLDMIADAKKDGITLWVGSAFRPAFPKSIVAKSDSGVSINATNQQYLYDGYIAGKDGFNLAAAPGTSKHGTGMAIDFNTGSGNPGVNVEIYKWLIKYSWKYGFIRTCRIEEWHFVYNKDLAGKGPYGSLAGTNANRFYTSLGLDKITIV